jgi:hypothetical protein
MGRNPKQVGRGDKRKALQTILKTIYLSRARDLLFRATWTIKPQCAFYAH